MRNYSKICPDVDSIWYFHIHRSWSVATGPSLFAVFWGIILPSFMGTFLLSHYKDSYCWWLKILHQLIGSCFHYVPGLTHPRWCRISSIKSRKLTSCTWVRFQKRGAPTTYKWSCNPYKWPCKWVTQVISPYLWRIIKVIPPFIPGVKMGPIGGPDLGISESSPIRWLFAPGEWSPSCLLDFSG